MQINKLKIIFIAVIFLLPPDLYQRACCQVPHHMPLRARHGMVASSCAIASKVGVEILKNGGNAVDAAVAVGMALAVVYPGAGNIGGGGFMLIRLADGHSYVIDYREAAPDRAHRDMFLDSLGKLIPDASTEGYMASGVPGTVAGFGMALEKFGSMQWRQVLEPARRFAAEGFPVSYELAKDLESYKTRLTKFPDSRRIFLKDGKLFNEGDTLKQPDLARTLMRLQENGPREFYDGLTARLITDDMKANGGLVRGEDLKNYKAILRQPITGTYRGYEIITIPPPSSGGVALIEMLNILENFDLTAAGSASSSKYHLVAEAMRRAFRDRAEFLGDPDFIKVPQEGLVSKRYASVILKTIDSARATPSSQLDHGNPFEFESDQTTHYTVIDSAGNTVSNTYTINEWFGNGAIVQGAGFFLNNEMDDFAAKPGTANMFGLIQGEANAIAPRKRPLSSMTPAIVLKGGNLYFALGSPGGPTIINTVLQVILNVIDHQMNIQQAVDAPRIHHQWQPDKIFDESFGLPWDVKRALELKGHTLDHKGIIGDVEAVMIEPGTGIFLGASDPRSQDAGAAGY